MMRMLRMMEINDENDGDELLLLNGNYLSDHDGNDNAENDEEDGDEFLWLNG